MTDDFPFDVEPEPFDRELWGAFGRFQTKDSFELSYILTGIPIQNIDYLSTASDSFDIKDIDFDELIQRDIDQERVVRIATKYLEEGTDRVLFFPPLLASLVIVEGTRIKDSYGAVEENADGDWCQWTWDSDKFRLELRKAPRSGPVTVRCGGDQYPIYHFGGKLQFNSNSAKLIVIDGQHRLSALRHIAQNKEKRALLDDLQIPVCIVITPGVEAASTKGQSITKNLRELFVRINQTAKQVSGHFITLLRDDRLHALAVRALADDWKRQESDEGVSLLHLIEWNQREDKRAYQSERAYSITTVSIIGDALADEVFLRDRTTDLLNLRSRQSEWPDEDGVVGPDNVYDAQFSLAEQKLIQEQIETEIVPALNKLLLHARPYRDLQQNVDRAFKWLRHAVASGRKAAPAFSDILEAEFRRPSRHLDGNEVVAVSDEFEAQIPLKWDDYYQVYFLNVFQQGYVRAWAEVSEKLAQLGVRPPKTAEILVDAWSKLVLDPSRAYFSSQRLYNQYTLYRDAKVALLKGNREQWVNLLWASFLNPETEKAFRKAVHDAADTDQADVDTALARFFEKAKTQLFEFLDYYHERIHKDFEKNWQDRGLKESEITRLERLYRSKQEDESSTDFDDYLLEITRSRMWLAKERLENVLQIRSLHRGE